MQSAPCLNCGETITRRGTRVPMYCNIDCKAEWQRKQKPVDRDWLYQKYIVEGLDCMQIAAIVHRNSKRVWEWIRDYRIPTRPRGSNVKENLWAPEKGKHPSVGLKLSAERKENLRQDRRRDGHVPYLKNGVVFMKGRSGSLSPTWKGGLTPERQAFYSTPEWKEAVKAIWKRADAKCERCGLSHGTVKSRGTFHIHHIVSFMVREMRLVISNLTLLCAGCHRFIHSRKNVDKELLG